MHVDRATSLTIAKVGIDIDTIDIPTNTKLATIAYTTAITIAFVQLYFAVFITTSLR